MIAPLHPMEEVSSSRFQTREKTDFSRAEEVASPPFPSFLAGVGRGSCKTFNLLYLGLKKGELYFSYLRAWED